jgi:hypothetical protein
MTTDSVRLQLPFIEAGQAQKEWTHNEALALLDIAVQATVEAVGVDAPPAGPEPGQCWAVGQAPSGAWAGQAGAIAGWTDGGWRFVAARTGLAVWSLIDGTTARYLAGGWRLDRSAPIAVPAGGVTIDTECRTAVAAILAALAARGWVG